MLLNAVEYCGMLLTGIVPSMHIVGQCIGTFTEHDADVEALAVIGHGQLASGDWNGCMTIWVCGAVLARMSTLL